MREAIKRLDGVMTQLIQADQTGEGMEPLELAHELGRIRAIMLEAPAVVPRADGQQHYRCEACGTITHAKAKPGKCPQCGGTTLWPADLAQPNVESGAG